MRRRRFVGFGSLAIAGLSGCLGRGRDSGTTTEPLEPSQVTTTGGADVEILVAQIVIREADAGPHVYYRLRNDGAADATVAVRTVLDIEGGGTYEATAYTDVGAGAEIFLEYQLVRYDALSEVEQTNVRRGDATFVVYVNGERRDV